MSRFIETMKVVDGLLVHGALHQERINRTFAKFYGGQPIPQLEALVSVPHWASRGTHKCRVVYDADHFQVAFHKPTVFDITSLRVVETSADVIDYEFKYMDRATLTALYEQRSPADDIIISVDGRPTDSYYANLIFFDGQTWWTPERPLLQGTQRAHLIDSGDIHVADIYTSELSSFEAVGLINAFLGLGDLVVPTRSVLY